jgi:hypothetical protein
VARLVQLADPSPVCASGVTADSDATAVTSAGDKAVGVGDGTVVAVDGKVACSIAGDGVALAIRFVLGVGLASSGLTTGIVAVGAGLEIPWVGVAFVSREQAVIMTTKAQKKKK